MPATKFVTSRKALTVIICVFFGLVSCSETPKKLPGVGMHPTWDSDSDGINDCEKEGSCDHTVDFRLPRPMFRPSFDCSKDALSQVEKHICKDPELAGLDNKLAKVFKQALAASKEPVPGPSFLKTEQRGWIKGRNECWKSDDLQQCTREKYQRRIAQLQARYRLVSSIGPIRFQCSDSPADELVVTYFATDPATLISERGDAVSLMFLSSSASGTLYQGRNESFREHQGKVILTWGANNTELPCQQMLNEQGL